MARSRPRVIISAAISVDGKLATAKNDSALSSKKDLTRVHNLRSKVDAILVGINTLLKDNPSLTVRYVKGKNPSRVVLDSKGRTPIDCKIVSHAKKIPTIVLTTDKISNRKKSQLVNAGVQVISCGKSRINLNKCMQVLKNMGIRTLMVEGGGYTNWCFVKNSLADELIVTVSPYVLGGVNSVNLASGTGFAKIKDALRLKLKSARKLGNDEVLLHYYCCSV